jgi:hypothetical protein
LTYSKKFEWRDRGGVGMEAHDVSGRWWKHMMWVVGDGSTWCEWSVMEAHDVSGRYFFFFSISSI